MPARVLVFDTSVLCCLLRVPGRETAGSGPERWTFRRVDALVKAETKRNSTFVLPLASLIETGNHVAQAAGDRFTVARALANLIAMAANATSPWAAFTDQAELWTQGRLGKLAAEWPELAKGGTSIGDATIKDVAEWYARAGFEVEIATADAGLKAHQPARPISIPRRRTVQRG